METPKNYRILCGRFVYKISAAKLKKLFKETYHNWKPEDKLYTCGVISSILEDKIVSNKNLLYELNFGFHESSFVGRQGDKLFADSKLDSYGNEIFPKRKRTK
jgi:hypothetical protein